jgi:hemoglobin/transferrin/lactoferrin receptor protein
MRELERQEVERKTTIVSHTYNPSNPYIDTGFKIYKNDTALRYLQRDNFDIESEGKGADLRNTFQFKNNDFIDRLTVGIDYEEEKGKTNSSTIEYENKGLFIQNRMAFNKFNLSFGGRYDDFENDLIYKTFNEDEFSFNVNGDYSISDNFTIFAGYGEAVSGSNTIPIGWLSNLDPNLTFNGSSSGKLEPQKAKKFEVGTDWQSSSLFTENDTFGFKVTLFKTDIDDPIVVGTGGRMGAPVSDIINDKDIETQGFEISSSYTIENLRTMLSYSHTDVEQDGETLKGTTKREAGSYGDKVVTDFTYTPTDRLMFGYTIMGVLENKDAADNASNKAGYTIHDISASYIPQEFKNMTFTIAVNNLFDKDYSAHSSLSMAGEAVGEPGRDVRVSLKYKF